MSHATPSPAPRRTLRRVIRLAIPVVILVLAGILLWNYSRIQRLLAVNSLFEHEHIAYNFTHMDELFHYQVITPTPGKLRHTWQRAEPSARKGLPTSFDFEGESVAVQAFLEQTDTTALLVLHHGEIVHEIYPRPEEAGGAEARRISWSVAKSFLSAVFGVALERGLIESLDDPVTKYAPALRGSAYDGVPIRHVLQMSSGVRFNEDYLDFGSDINKMGRVLAIGGSMDAFAASIEGRERESGVSRHYVSIDTHVIGMVLRGATGMPVRDFLNEALWSKLGVEQEIYYVTDEEGVDFVLGGLNMRTRDYARFGQLYLQDGKWLGEQVIPRAWVRESTAASAPASKDDGMGYGYQWWVPKRANEEFFAIGIYGQYIYVNRVADMVVVKNSTHIRFRDDGAQGTIVEDRNIELFRAIARHYAGEEAAP